MTQFPVLTSSKQSIYADLQAKKADVAARRSALRGRAIVPATWPEPPLVAITGLKPARPAAPSRL